MLVRQRLYLGLFFLSVSVALVLTIALSLPETSWTFSISEEQQLQASNANKAPMNIDFFMIGSKQVQALSHLALDEPDTVETYEEFNYLMSVNNLLLDNIQALSMQLADGSIHKLDMQPRSISNLPAIFWLQIVCGSLGFLICVLIKSTGNSQRGVNDFVLTGFSYLLFTFTAAIYSTKNLLIDGQLFHVLSMLNHAGAMLFSAALSAFLWNYPKVIGGYFVSTFAYLVFVINMLVDGFQLVEGPAMGSYLWVFSLFLFALLGSAVQWWKARKNPLDRGAVRWLLISIYAGTIFFAGGMMLPILLGLPPLASQGLMFTTFLLMYGGLALGVIRYRLFDLERWWFSIWAWFLGGVAILLIDVVIASFLTLSSTSALVLATAIVGWLYFPLRQWCWHYLSYRRGLTIEAWLPHILARLVNVKTPLQLENAWLASLQDFYRPLNIDIQLDHEADQSLAASIEKNGLQLSLPKLTRSGRLVLSNANQGQRLFTRSDIKNYDILWTMFDLMHKALLAKAEGATAERDRIRQDIHDDLGAKLLSIQLSSKEKEPAKLAKEALNDLRNLLQSIEIEPIALSDALHHWQQEAQERLPETVQLNWQIMTQNIELELSPEHFSQLTRTIRECITNALKHSKTTEIHFRLNLSDTLEITISNNGLVNQELSDSIKIDELSGSKGGRGSDILRQRCHSLGGSFKHWEEDDKWFAYMSIPLTP
jgi:signal transduction histidine kinase